MTNASETSTSPSSDSEDVVNKKVEDDNWKHLQDIESGRNSQLFTPSPKQPKENEDASASNEKIEQINPDLPPVILTKKELYLTFMGLMFGLFLASLDQTIVSTALPKIISDFGRLDLYSWVIVSYLLTSTTVIPLCGKFSDLFGRKILFQGSIALFTVASVLCGVSPNMISLIVFRALQGLAGGGLMSLTQIIIGDVVSVRDRGKYAGVIGICFAVASVIGPVLGGAITDISQSSWRFIFYINIPFGIVAFIVIQLFLKLPAPKHNKTKLELLKDIDFIGVFLFVTGIVGVLCAASLGGEQYEWNSVPIIVLFVVGGVLLFFFILNEALWAKNPIIPLGQFKNKNISLANLIAFFVGYGMFGGISYLPVYFQFIRGDSPTTSGLKLIPMMFGLIGASMGSGIAIAKTGYYYHFPMIGCGLAALGYGLLYLIKADWAYGNIVGILIVIGMGVGSLLQTLVIVTQFFSKKSEIAITTSTVTFTRTMGGVVGVTIFGAILNSVLKSKLPEALNAAAKAGSIAVKQLPPAAQHTILIEYNSTLRIVFVSAVPVLGLAMVLGFFIKNARLTQPGQKSTVEVPMEGI